MGSALLVIDMQQALLPVVWHADELAERIAGLVCAAHERQIPVVAIQQTGQAGTPFEAQSAGWQVDPRLGIGEADLRVRKSATDSFFRTELNDVLTVRGIDTVLVSGVTTDYCVDATVRAALSRGLNVDLVSDGHAPAADGDAETGLSPEEIVSHHNQILNQAIHPGGRLRLIPANEAFVV